MDLALYQNGEAIEETEIPDWAGIEDVGRALNTLRRRALPKIFETLETNIMENGESVLHEKLNTEPERQQRPLPQRDAEGGPSAWVDPQTGKTQAEEAAAATESTDDAEETAERTSVRSKR
jgi:hypothetical protein